MLIFTKNKTFLEHVFSLAYPIPRSLPLPAGEGRACLLTQVRQGLGYDESKNES